MNLLQSFSVSFSGTRVEGSDHSFLVNRRSDKNSGSVSQRTRVCRLSPVDETILTSMRDMAECFQLIKVILRHEHELQLMCSKNCQQPTSKFIARLNDVRFCIPSTAHWLKDRSYLRERVAQLCRWLLILNWQSGMVRSYIIPTPPPSQPEEVSLPEPELELWLSPPPPLWPPLKPPVPAPPIPKSGTSTNREVPAQ